MSTTPENTQSHLRPREEMSGLLSELQLQPMTVRFLEQQAARNVTAMELAILVNIATHSRPGNREQVQKLLNALIENEGFQAAALNKLTKVEPVKLLEDADDDLEK